MPPTAKRKTVFDADDDLLTQFQARLKLEKVGMNTVIESWITEFMAGKRTVGSAPLPTEGTCPLCESSLGISSDGLTLIKAGPIEPMVPGEVPEELMPMVRSTVQYYLTEPFFRRMLNAVIADYKSEKK